MKTRIIAVLAAIVIVAAACSETEAANAETAQQIEELQQRLDTLTDNAVEPAAEQATTEAPTTTDAPQTTTTTTTTEPPPPVVFESTSTPDESLGVLLDIQGPTDDLTGQMQRLDADFVDLTTPPNAAITAATTFIRNIPGSGFIQESTLVYTTSNDPLQTVEGLEAELLATFPAAPVQRTESDAGGGQTAYRSTVGDYFFTVLPDGATTSVTLNRTETGSISVDEIAVFDGITTALTPPPGAALDYAQVTNFVSNPKVLVRWYFPGVTADQAASLIDTHVAQNGLAINIGGESYIGSQTLTEITLDAYSTDAVGIDRGHEPGVFLDVDFNL